MKPTRPYLANVRARMPEPEPRAPREASKPQSRLHRFANRFLEAGVAVLLTLVCFVALLLVLIRVLPSATDLGDLFTAREESLADESGRSTLTGALDPTTWKDITLEVIDNEVMRKEANSIAWKRTKSGVRLAFGDGIQTTRLGMAVVTFDRSDHLRIGRNSVVMLNQLDRGLLADSAPAASFTVVSGELWGSFRTHPSPVQVSLPTAHSTTRLELGGGQPAQFKVTVGEDQTSTIAVERGSMRVLNADRALQLGEHEYVVVNAGGKLSQPKKLVTPPEPLQPADQERRLYREFPPKLTFRWRPSNADEYRLVIAHDKELQQVVFDERTRAATYSLGGLAAGEYWWVVRAVEEGVDGWSSRPRRLTLVVDREPPALQVTFPASRTNEKSVAISGTAEPGTQVFVAGRRTAVETDGSFSTTAALRPGVNLVVVEAVDAVGNSAYRSQEIRLVQEGGAHP